MSDLSDIDRRDMAWRNAMKSSKKQGNHPYTKTSNYFGDQEWSEVNEVIRQGQGLPVAAGWIEGQVSWVLLTRAFLFKDIVWKNVFPWDTRIDYGDFKGLDQIKIRQAIVSEKEVVVGKLTYETGDSSMVLLNGFLTIERLRRPSLGE